MQHSTIIDPGSLSLLLLVSMYIEYRSSLVLECFICLTGYL